MTHLQLDQFQALLDQNTPQSQRDTLVDHILDCDACATRFKTLKALEDACPNPARPKRHLLRYGLGVAAVMVMAISPYLSRNLGTPSSAIAEWDQAMGQAPTESFAVTKKILNVNYQAAVTHWAENKDVLQLVDLQNQTRTH